MASCVNPVDMVASAGPEAYRRTIETVLAAPETDAVIIIFTSVEANTTAQILESMREGVARGRARAPGKPVLACVMAEPAPVPIELSGELLPTYPFPENAVRALGKVATYAEWRRQSPALYWSFDDIDVERARAICRSAVASRGDTWLNDEEVRGVLSAFRLPLAAGSIARSADEAAALAARIGFPVAAKLSSVTIQHKTDIGAVRLNLADAAAVRRAFQDILAAARRAQPSATYEAVLIQPMLTGGVETMMGIALDQSFGPLIAFGLGGIHVEVLGDVRFRIAPLTDRDADELLHEIIGFRLLEGFRGHPAGDLDALRELLLRLSRLAEELPEAVELDLNPVIALPPGHGCAILDARIKVKRSP
jgi:acyl-CoA synthetase (NDP forming)